MNVIRGCFYRNDAEGTWIFGPLAQLVEQLTLNQRVEGSIPSRPTPVRNRQFCVMSEVAVPVRKPRVRRQTRLRPVTPPRYHVVLLNDDDHTYDYVIEMLTSLFGHSQEEATRMAEEVDRADRVIVETTHKERAELKRDQIHSYGPDWRLSHSTGPMGAVIEPAA